MNNLEIVPRGVTKCHNSADNSNSFYRTDVECSKENLFSGEYKR